MIGRALFPKRFAWMRTIVLVAQCQQQAIIDRGDVALAVAITMATTFGATLAPAMVIRIHKSFNCKPTRSAA